MKKGIVIGIDFDGTCVTHDFPEIGKDIGAVPVLKRLVANGHKLILFTMRCNNQAQMLSKGSVNLKGGNYLDAAVEWFKENDIPLYGIQRNPAQDSWTNSPKAYAKLYIDDANICTPLIYPKIGRPYVDWVAIEKELIKLKIL